MTDDRELRERRARAKRFALVLAVVAAGVYAAFMLMQHYR